MRGDTFGDAELAAGLRELLGDDMDAVLDGPVSASVLAERVLQFGA